MQDLGIEDNEMRESDVAVTPDQGSRGRQRQFVVWARGDQVGLVGLDDSSTWCRWAGQGWRARHQKASWRRAAP